MRVLKEVRALFVYELVGVGKFVHRFLPRYAGGKVGLTFVISFPLPSCPVGVRFAHEPWKIISTTLT